MQSAYVSGLPGVRVHAEDRRGEHRTGPKKIHHPAVGDLELNFETMSLDSDPSLTLVIYTAVPHSPNADALRLLATWAATQNQSQTDHHERLT
ncbi:MULTISPECIES: hypothetical protein [unclassified Streptomyces]|uniref:MmyB family transcriptional regulator n=1 Tax=unclassified Streptomyces TaxID=2593676 RepID=UPI00210E4152|nr:MULTISPECIES: hypothetical protein [unclassified Streptomyces]